MRASSETRTALEVLRDEAEAAGGLTAYADKIGIGRTTLSNWLRRGGAPKPRHILILAPALRLPVAAIVWPTRPVCKVFKLERGWRLGR